MTFHIKYSGIHILDYFSAEALGPIKTIFYI